MATLLTEVVSYLETEGIGAFGTNIFIGFEPDMPKNSVTLYPTGGRTPGALDGREFPTMQVRVKNATYPDGYAVAERVFGKLHKQKDFLSTFRGRCFALQSSPLFIGHGRNGEFLFTQNYIFYLAHNPNTSSSSSSSSS